MKQSLNSLTWNYFLEQKVKEILITSISILLIIFIPLMIGSNIGDGYSVECGDSKDSKDSRDIEYKCGNIETWFEGLFLN